MKKSIFTIKYSKENFVKIELIFFSIAIWIFSTYRIQELHAPIVLLDEFGYWSAGAFFNNLDWSGIAKFNSYYSYGYGLILGILIYFFKDTSFLYQSAVMVNALFLIGCFFMLYRIGKIFFPESDKLMLCLVAFVSIMYPSYYANAHIGWSETSLVFLYIAGLYIFLMFLIKKKLQYLIVWTLLLMYSYATHQRCLGIIVAGILTIFVLLYNKQITRRDVFCFFIVLGICFVIHTNIKSMIMEQLYLSEENTNAVINDYPSIAQHVFNELNLAGFVRIFKSMIGKIGYLIISTGFLLGMGIFSLVKKILAKAAFTKRLTYAYVYMILSLFFTILIASVFTSMGGRIDSLLYGRYTEWCIAPVFVIGLLGLVMQKINLIVQIRIILGELVIVIPLIWMYQSHPEWEQYYAVCAIAIFYFYQITENSVFLICYAIKAALLGFGVECFLFLKKKYIYLGLLIYILYFSVLGYFATERIMLSNYRCDLVRNMQEQIKEKGKNENIYYVKDEGQTIWYVADLQVLLPRKEITNITLNEIENKNETYFLILDTYGELGRKLTENKEALVTNWQVSLFHMNSDKEVEK